MADRPGSSPRAWQRMLSGRRLDLLDPSPLDVEIEDIAHGLARVARWNGQTRGPYPFSVAQHSLVVEEIALRWEPTLSPADRLAVLLHDAAEYVIGDMISPFKAVIGPTYKDVEKRLAAAVHLRFGLPPAMRDDLARLAKRADLVSAYFEAIELAGFTVAEATKIFGRPKGFGPAYGLDPWPTELVQERFIERFRTLDAAATAARGG
ncbi:YfbR-like 5'-deoxynucleotidase [Methyloraptor flagellatus]|uniref:HD family hydrolase n=1 Tax=Methyloraptor flagellatus TaxID=3162530 RepID=A0AAU7X5N7_9HYPH